MSDRVDNSCHAFNILSMTQQETRFRYFFFFYTRFVKCTNHFIVGDWRKLAQFSRRLSLKESGGISCGPRDSFKIVMRIFINGNLQRFISPLPSWRRQYPQRVCRVSPKLKSQDKRAAFTKRPKNSPRT